MTSSRSGDVLPAPGGRPAASPIVVSEPVAARRTAYSPDLRTAVVLTGTGADGAYHAGVLHALQEAGVRVDLLAGHGIGAVGRCSPRSTAAPRLWSPMASGGRGASCRLYPWRAHPARAGAVGRRGRPDSDVPAVMLALGLLVTRPPDFWMSPAPAPRHASTSAYVELVAFAVPARWAADLAAAPCAGAAGVRRRLDRCRRDAGDGKLPVRKRQRGGFWWSTLGAPIASADTAGYFRRGLWDLLRGGTAIREPAPTDLGRRVAELVTDNLSQPGFRELLMVVHDLDAEHDLVFALLGNESRRSFFLRKPARWRSPIGGGLRSGWRVARQHAPCRRRRARPPGRL